MRRAALWFWLFETRKHRNPPCALVRLCLGLFRDFVQINQRFGQLCDVFAQWVLRGSFSQWQAVVIGLTDLLAAIGPLRFDRDIQAFGHAFDA